MLGDMKRKSFSAEQWRRIFAEHQSSGLAVAAYCRRSRVPQASFYLWRRKLRDAAHFAEVRVGPEPAAVGDHGALELVLPGGRRVVVQAGFDEQTLLRLLDTLEHGTADAGGATGREAGA